MKRIESDMKAKELESMIEAADNMAHVCAYVSGRLDICGLSAKQVLSLISECCSALNEAADGWWKTKGTDEDGMPPRETNVIREDVFPKPIQVKCSRCREGNPIWSDDYEPLFTIRCDLCNAHTKPALTAEIARNRWIFAPLIECGSYREGGVIQ